MAEFNRLCSECEFKVPQLAWKCANPPVLICVECLGSHVSKSPEAQHSQSPIVASDLEEAKQTAKNDWHNKLK